MFGGGTIVPRTLSIEVGMQNSGLAVALAGTIFSLWQNLTGVALARIWSRDAQNEGDKLLVTKYL